MRAHLDEETTRLAAIWRITRKDGAQFFFTDQDRDIVFGGDTYRADAGFARTAIRSDAGFLRPWNEVPALMGSAPPATSPSTGTGVVTLRWLHRLEIPSPRATAGRDRSTARLSGCARLLANVEALIQQALLADLLLERRPVTPPALVQESMRLRAELADLERTVARIDAIVAGDWSAPRRAGRRKRRPLGSDPFEQAIQMAARTLDRLVGGADEELPQ
jgi:hypothetical protein